MSESGDSSRALASSGGSLRSGGGLGSVGSEPFFETLSGGGHVGILLLDYLGRIVDVNPAAQFLLGRPSGDLVGHELGQIPGMHAGDDKPIEINCISDDGKVRFCELRMHCTEIEVMDEAAETFRIAQEAGEAYGMLNGDTRPALYVGTLYDVTPYRDAAVTAYAEVVRRDEFLATLSHELRNPLSAITSGFELLRQPDLDQPARGEASQVISQQLTQLRRLLDDLLDMTRLAHHRVQLKVQPCDLREPIRAAASMAAVLTDSEQSENVEQRITLDLPGEPLPLEGDSARLEQLVANLIVNALKYGGPEGTVCVTARRFADCDAAERAAAPKGGDRGADCDRVASVEANTPIEPGPGGVIELRVCDEGDGIDPDLLPYLFDPFVQAQRTFGRSDGGFGIGLTLVRDLAKLHSGRVWAESEGAGAGATFVVQLPAADMSAAPTTPARPAGELPPLSVLLVEDVPAIRKVTAKLLERLGHDVVQAIDVPTAMQALESRPFDLGLIDIGLPGPSGLTLGSAVRGNPDRRTMRMIALTGYGQDNDIEASRRAGFDHHLVKPFDLTEFGRVLQTLFADRVAN